MNRAQGYKMSNMIYHLDDTCSKECFKDAPFTTCCHKNFLICLALPQVKKVNLKPTFIYIIKQKISFNVSR